MATWTSDELNKIGKAEELQIASLRKDGTLRKWVIIWVVRVGGDLYVRSANGPTGSWFRSAQAHRAGLIRAGGVEKGVVFVGEADPGLNDPDEGKFILIQNCLSTNLAQVLPSILPERVLSNNFCRFSANQLPGQRQSSPLYPKSGFDGAPH